jgi:hypothetical protein
MSDDRIQELGLKRRAFMKKAAAAVFAAPVVVSFALDGVAEAHDRPGDRNPIHCLPNSTMPNMQCPNMHHPNQHCPNMHHPNQHHPNQHHHHHRHRHHHHHRHHYDRHHREAE